MTTKKFQYWHHGLSLNQINQKLKHQQEVVKQTIINPKPNPSLHELINNGFLKQFKIFPTCITVSPEVINYIHKRADEIKLIKLPRKKHARKKL